MTNIEMISKWLKDNTNLSWNRTEGDSPSVKVDSLYINRSEAYEIRDLINSYYKECNLEYKNDNFEITYKKIINYKKGIKVKRDEILNYLVDGAQKAKSKTI